MNLSPAGVIAAARVLLLAVLSIIVPRPCTAGDSTDVAAPDRKGVWLNVEMGVHTPDPGSSMGYRYVTSSGLYQRLLFEIPFGTRIGMATFVDWWWLEDRPHRDFGLGVDLILSHSARTDILVTPCASFGDGLGLLLLGTVGYRPAGWDNVRLQASLAYRPSGVISMGGGNSYSFISCSAGVGLNLSELLPHRR